MSASIVSLSSIGLIFFQRHRRGATSVKFISERQRGMTLLELTVVLLILTTLATVALRATSGLQDQARWELTKNRYDEIKKAIIGDPKLIINGQPDISGFIADMGRLPNNIKELLSQNYCDNDFSETVPGNCTGNWINNTDNFIGCSDGVSGEEATCNLAGEIWHDIRAGWNGPYLSTKEISTDPDAFSDGWGNVAVLNTDLNYGWSTFGVVGASLNIQSAGCNGCSLAAYNNAYPANAIAINQNDWLINIGGGITVTLTAPYVPDPVTACDATGVEETLVCQNAHWNGGTCSNVAYKNKIDCEANAGAWTACTATMPTSKSFCESNGGIWAFNTINVCARITFRNEVLGTVITPASASTHLAGTAIGTQATITENGSTQVITFDSFTAPQIPMGFNTFGLYEFDGDCNSDNVIYPAGAQLIEVAFLPNKNIATINW
ncbi:MAG: prepilin-type N-terminal cleavage/methylation domain-containing protein [Gammaproteobacteria bacterium]